MSEALIDIEIEDERWLAALPDAQGVIERAAIATLDYMQVEDDSDIVMLLTDDAEMQALNKEYRKKNAPTNVLSFPAPGMMDGHLGDIAMGLDICVKEAREQNKHLKDHVTHLTVHAVLHLLGYDHMEEAQATEMEDLERTILATLHVADPYRDI